MRDWTHDRHRTVDDAPFGGGQGAYEARSIFLKQFERVSDQADVKPYVVFFSPVGRPYSQVIAQRVCSKSAFCLFAAVMRGMMSESMSWQMTLFLWEITF